MSHECYDTDLINWICSCPAYLFSRFLVCKHLVQSVCHIEGNSNFFYTVQRNYAPPFDHHPDLVPLSSSSVNGADSETDERSSSPDFSDDEIDSFSECLSQTEVDDVEVGEVEGEEISGIAEHTKAKEILQQALAIIDDQDSTGGDPRWMRTVNSELGGLERMLSTIKQFKGRPTMPRTWKDINKFIMFFKF